MRRVLALLLLFSIFAPVGVARASYVMDVPPTQSSAAVGGPNQDIQKDIVDPATSNVTTGTPSLNTLVNVRLYNAQNPGQASSQGIFGLGLINAYGVLVGINDTSTSGPTTMIYPGAIGTTLNMTSLALTNPPVSSREYIADLMNTVGHPFAQTAYAQGLGFSSLSPVLGLWKIFRNIAYFFFIVIFVFIGFLIMIRSKIGSQAAVTVQQALPKLVVSLILVTFSYAIAGLLLDLMYLIIYLLIGIFSTGDGVLSSASLSNIAFQNNIFGNGFKLITGVVGGVAGSIGQIVNSITTTAFGGTGLAEAAGKVAGGVTNVIASLVIALAILVSLFRVFFALVQAYVGIFFSVIFAPIQLLIGALPGQNTFGAWIKGLLENILVFPTLILLLFISYYFTLGPTFSSTNPGFIAPQMGSNQGNGFAAYQGLLALGAILAMPEILKVTKGVMKGQLGVGVDDLKKNFEAGKKHLGTPVKIGANIAGGTVIGGLGAREFARGSEHRGAATILGALGGGIIGGTSGLPYKLGSKAIGGLATQSGRAIAATGIRRGTQFINTRRADEEARRRDEEAKAALSNIPDTTTDASRSGNGNINQGRT